MALVGARLGRQSRDVYSGRSAESGLIEIAGDGGPIVATGASAHTRAVSTSSSATRRAVAAVVDAVELALAPAGWRRRALAVGLPFDTFTLDVGDGIIATAEIQRPLLSITLGGSPWPVHVSVDLGVGFEPALGLMPLLGMPAIPRMLRNPACRDDAGDFEIQGESADQRDSAVRAIVAFIADHAAVFAASYDARSITDELGHQADRAAEDGGRWWRERHLVMLAALDRRNEAETLVQDYEHQYTDRAERMAARRFTRQLRRRLASMPTPIPPPEHTISQLPPPRSLCDRPKYQFGAAWRRSRAIDRAIKTVKSRAGARSLAEVRDMLAHEFQANGVGERPSAIALAAERIDADRTPRGGAESGLRTLWKIGQAIGDVVHTIASHQAAVGPRWMWPPDRAAFEYKTSDDRTILIAVDVDAHDYLSRAASDGMHVGRLARFAVWLPAPDPADDRVVVHLGQRRIGTVSAADMTFLAPAFRAASIFDEDVVLQAQLVQTSDGVDIVELFAGDMHATPNEEGSARD